VFRKIEAHVRQERVEAVRQAPLRVGVPAMDTVEVLGHGRQTGIRLAGRHWANTVDAFPHVRLTVVVGAQDVTGAVGAVRRGAAMGVQADGAF